MMLEALQKWFGHTAFREGQEAPIRAVLSGQDAVVIMPTGSGKSLCYQLAAMSASRVRQETSPRIAGRDSIMKWSSPKVSMPNPIA